MYNKKNGLCSISGHITRKTSCQLKDSRHKLKDDLRLCLAEMNNVKGMMNQING